MAKLEARFIETIPTQCELGEGPVWDHRTQSLWLTDIQKAQLLHVDWDSQEVTRYALPERLGSFALTSETDRLLCAFASGIALFRPGTNDLNWVARIEPHYRGIRLNDGRVDRQGRFWVGSMVEDESLAPPEKGTLYRIDKLDSHAPSPVFDGISISNSICFSPDGERAYFADTPRQEIVWFEMDAKTGALGAGSTLARLANDAFPDGSDVDAEGRVWNAEWGTGRVTVYAPDGRQLAQVNLPATQATCIAFGGPHLDLLFVTTAKEGLSSEQLAAQPLAGDVHVYRTNTKGLQPVCFGI